MTDSNVGARKSRNIRDNLFVFTGVIKSMVNKELHEVDVKVYDIAVW